MISVVIPLYNHQDYISQTLDSILCSEKVNEIIVVDDCSTDSSLEIVKSYEDKRIIVIEKDINKGVVDSLNRGVRLATEEYIYFCASDDVPIISGVEYITDKCSANELDFYIGGGLYKHDDGSFKNTYKSNTRIFLEKISREKLVTLFIDYPKPLLLQTSIFRRDFVTSLGGFDKLKIDDYPFFIKAFRAVKFGKFGHKLNCYCCYYRIHQTNFSDNPTRQFETQIEVFNIYAGRMRNRAIANRLAFHLIIQIKKCNFSVVIDLLRMTNIKQKIISFRYFISNLVSIVRD